MIELAEIDENMIRRNLSPVETALAVTRRAELERSLNAIRSKEREEREGKVTYQLVRNFPTRSRITRRTTASVVAAAADPKTRPSD